MSQIPYYARPGFDPESLGENELSSILTNNYNVKTTGLKKRELVEAFTLVVQASETSKEESKPKGGSPPRSPFQQSASRTIFDVQPKPQTPVSSSLNPTTSPSPNRGGFLTLIPIESPSPSPSKKAQATPLATSKTSTPSKSPKLRPKLSIDTFHPLKGKSSSGGGKSLSSSSSNSGLILPDEEGGNCSTLIYIVGLLIAATLCLAYLFPQLIQSSKFCDSLPSAGQELGGQKELKVRGGEGCIPCPSKADCKGGVATCWTGLVLSTTGVCKPDPRLMQKKEELFQKLADYLETENGKFICGEGGVERLTEGELWKVSNQFLPETQGLNLVFNEGLRALEKQEIDVGITIFEEGGVNYFKATYPELSFSCWIQISTRKFWNENHLQIMGSLVGLLIFGKAMWNLRARFAQKKRVKHIVRQLKQVLKEQKKKDPPFIAISHIRQSLLDHSPGFQKQDFDEISKILKSDPRIQEAHQDVRGEDRLVWEWTAPDVLDSEI